VDEEFLWAGHIFLGFSKCGRYVLSYTSSSGDDDFSFYLYHLYWWEFNVHSKLRLVRQVRLFQDEEIYSDLYLTVCEWPGPACLCQGFLLHTKFQVVYPFPTFQPAFQLRKDHVVLLNTSFSLVACAIAVHPAGTPGYPPASPDPPQDPPEPPYLTVEQLTLDFEYVINEVIRNDAAWSRQFCSFSDYDIVILEVCPETNQVVINIGLLLLAFPSPDEEGQLRPRTYHTSLKVAWDLNSGTFATVGVGDLTEVKGQTRLFPEGSGGQRALPLDRAVTAAPLPAVDTDLSPRFGAICFLFFFDFHFCFVGFFFFLLLPFSVLSGWGGVPRTSNPPSPK
ncbi:PREDICTED: DDB1- and CUL4-associated factor 15, partial [Corvus brachyrhynchos]|uniref:DDB1- and CUL4-associated factor 15 n=1 Tax=Corvus brachyrhynchos TaxID=85066 RepID=UPI0008164D6E